MTTPAQKKAVARYKDKKTKEVEVESWLDALKSGELEPAVDAEVPDDVYIDYLRKTPYGLWKEIDASDLGTDRHKDNYALGPNYTCEHCNTSFRTRNKEPECPFCHRAVEKKR